MKDLSVARVASLVLVVTLVIVGAVVVFGGGPAPIKLSADFVRTTGLYQGNDVTVLGVPVGTVTSIKPDGPLVHVTLEIRADTPIPATAKAVIMQRSLVTDRYIELTPPYDDGSRLESGASIPISRTISPIGADDVLASVNHLLDALDAAGHRNLQALIHAGAANFAGNGSAVARIIVGVRKLVATGAASTGDLNSIVDGLDQLTLALTKRDALVNRFSSDLTTVTAQFANDRKTFGATIKELGTSLRFLTSFVVRNQKALGSGVQRIAALAVEMHRHERQLSRVMKVTPLAFLNTARAVSPSGQLYVNFNAGELARNPTLLSTFCQGALKVLCPKAFAGRTSGAGPAGSRSNRVLPLSLRSMLGGVS